MATKRDKTETKLKQNWNRMSVSEEDAPQRRKLQTRISQQTSKHRKYQNRRKVFMDPASF